MSFATRGRVLHLGASLDVCDVARRPGNQVVDSDCGHAGDKKPRHPNRIAGEVTEHLGEGRTP